MQRIYILTGILTVFNITLWGQGTVFFKASRNEQMNHFVDASNAYQGMYLRGSREASLQAARNLYKARRYEEALPLYEFADSIKIISDAEQVFAFFECLKSVKRYEEADLLVKARLGEFAARPEFGLHHEKIDYYKSILSFNGAQLQLLQLNSEFSEISPTVYNDWLYFVSTRPATGNHTVHRINMQPFYNLYGTPVEKAGPQVAFLKGSFGRNPEMISVGSYQTKSLPEGINKKFHDGPLNISPSGKYMFFTSNQFEGRKAKETINLMIWYSENKDGVWQTPQSLPLNSLEHSNQHGFFDEANSTLYFASNRPEGQGGWDIWKCKLESNGRWSNVENLGPGVNTVKTEVFPSLSPDGSLIFASNGWPGLGGLDLFLSQAGENPLNLLAGINSEKDDFGLIFTGKENGYLVSNRKGGAGDDDIYSFKMKFDVSELKKFNRNEVLVQITLVDKGSGGKIGAAQAVLLRDESKTPVNLKDGDLLGLITGDKITLEVSGYVPVTVDVQDQLLSEGKFTAGFEPLPAVTMNRNNNANTNNQANTAMTQTENSNPTVEIKQAGNKMLEIIPIGNQKFIAYFDYKSFSVRKDATEILAKVAYILLKEYEMAEVLLSGHTDNRGSETNNKQLSNKRVTAIRNWLVEKGVNPNRIRMAYFGESKPVIRCEMPAHKNRINFSCLTEADHQLNRRVEIEIINLLQDK